MSVQSYISSLRPPAHYYLQTDSHPLYTQTQQHLNANVTNNNKYQQIIQYGVLGAATVVGIYLTKKFFFRSSSSSCCSSPVSLPVLDDEAMTANPLLLQMKQAMENVQQQNNKQPNNTNSNQPAATVSSPVPSSSSAAASSASSTPSITFNVNLQHPASLPSLSSNVQYEAYNCHPGSLQPPVIAVKPSVTSPPPKKRLSFVEARVAHFESPQQAAKRDELDENTPTVEEEHDHNHNQANQDNQSHHDKQQQNGHDKGNKKKKSKGK